MLRSLNAGVSGMQQSQARIDLIGNNIANVNTAGYKAARMDFADAFSQTLRSSAPNGAAGSSSALQVGSGVEAAAVKNRYTQGAMTNTGIETDMAIAGEGFFVVKDTGTNMQYATRAGEFHLDNSGYLVNNNGLRVQGYTDGQFSTVGDIQINDTGRPAGASPDATLSSYQIDDQGRITVRLSDGTSFVRGQILLQNFRNPQALIKEGNNLYSGFAAAGALAAPEAPTTKGLGGVRTNTLELSNVDLAGEFASLITTQRAFQANARIITTSDEVLQEMINLKR